VYSAAVRKASVTETVVLTVVQSLRVFVEVAQTTRGREVSLMRSLAQYW